MKVPSALVPLIPTRHGRPDRPMIAASLMFLTGVVLILVQVGASAGVGEESGMASALGALAALLFLGGLGVYLVTRTVRGVRWLRGEQEPEPPPVASSEVLLAPPRHRVRNFFLWLIGIPVGFVVFSMIFTLIVLGVASRRVENVRASIHPGMTAPQVLHNASGWFMLSARPLRPDRADQGLTITSFYQGRYHLLSFEGPHQALTEAELLERIRQMADGGEWRLVFTYTTMTPARYSFAVRFSAEGKVIEVPPLRSWD